MMTFASLFSGIGAPDLAAARLGLKHLWMCEIAPFQRKVLAKRFEGVRVYDDIRRLHARGFCPDAVGHAAPAGASDGRPDSATLSGGGTGTQRADCDDCAKRPDILWASPPCQDLSIAGKRSGISGARSGLFFDFARVVGELQPTWILMEQVPGLLSSNGGRDFATALDALEECGYGLAWRTLDSRYLGVPQRRRRIYLVGRFGEPCPAEVLFESEGGSGDSAAGREEGQGTPDEVGERTTDAIDVRNLRGQGGVTLAPCARKARTVHRARRTSRALAHPSVASRRLSASASRVSQMDGRAFAPMSAHALTVRATRRSGTRSR